MQCPQGKLLVRRFLTLTIYGPMSRLISFRHIKVAFIDFLFCGSFLGFMFFIFFKGINLLSNVNFLENFCWKSNESCLNAFNSCCGNKLRCGYKEGIFAYVAKTNPRLLHILTYPIFFTKICVRKPNLIDKLWGYIMIHLGWFCWK